jgi:RimJ/RimL family protein N-acetyltransferase
MAATRQIKGIYKDGELLLKPLHCIPEDERTRLYKTYAEWLNQEHIRRGTGDVSDYTVKDVEEILKLWADSNDDYHWIIYAEVNGAYVPVGDINLRRLSAYSDLFEIYRRHDQNLDNELAKISVEIAFLCTMPFQGRGIATGATKAVLEDIKGEGVVVVYSNAFEDNIASRRVHEKIRFEEIGKDTEENRNIVIYRKILQHT